MRAQFVIPIIFSILFIGSLGLTHDVRAQPIITNIGQAGSVSDADGNLFAFRVLEFAQGNTDLNGDIDVGDRVVHVFDKNTGITINTGLATLDNPKIDGNIVAVRVSEFRQGNTDLNGDGDTFDRVIFYYDLTTGIATNLGLAAGLTDVDGNLIAFFVQESSQGVDLNGDGDTNDLVAHVHDVSTGITTNIGIASTATALIGNIVLLNVFESKEGAGTDFNGDGDSTDQVAHYYDTTTGILTNIGIASIAFSLDGNIIALSVTESRQGNTDLNGDGDTSDNVLQYHDIGTGITTNVGIATGIIPNISGNFISFTVPESSQGNLDLNGDGDTSDNIVHIHDIASAITTNLGLASFFPVMDGNLVAFSAFESFQGNTDLNGDGDTSDGVVHVHDVSTGITTNVGIAILRLNVGGDLVGFTVPESSQGIADLNSDGDTNDVVLHVYQASSGTTTNLGLDGKDKPVIHANNLLFTVREADQGNIDLNGDGDTIDDVVHIAQILVDDGKGPKGKNNPCDALEKAEDSGEGKKKGLERAKANNDC